MSRYEEMEAFARVAEAESVSGAAEKLGVAKSAVSRRLSDLEQRLGVQLVQRTTRRLSLTETGRGFYQYCNRILADVAEAEAYASEEQATLKGRLRIAAPLTFGIRHLSPHLADFAAAHPDLTLDVDFNDRRVDLIEEGVDAAVRIGVLADSSLIARRICAIRMIASAAPDFWAQAGVPARAEDLAGMALLQYSNAGMGGRMAYTAPDGAKGAVQMTPRLSSNNGDFLADAALRGMGVLITPEFIVHGHLRDGRLQAVLADHDWGDVALHVVYPPTRHLSRRVRAFVDFVVATFGARQPWR